MLSKRGQEYLGISFIKPLEKVILVSSKLAAQEITRQSLLIEEDLRRLTGTFLITDEKRIAVKFFRMSNGRISTGRIIQEFDVIIGNVQAPSHLIEVKTCFSDCSTQSQLDIKNYLKQVQVQEKQMKLITDTDVRGSLFYILENTSAIPAFEKCLQGIWTNPLNLVVKRFFDSEKFFANSDKGTEIIRDVREGFLSPAEAFLEIPCVIHGKTKVYYMTKEDLRVALEIAKKKPDGYFRGMPCLDRLRF